MKFSTFRNASKRKQNESAPLNVSTAADFTCAFIMKIMRSIGADYGDLLIVSFSFFF